MYNFFKKIVGFVLVALTLVTTVQGEESNTQKVTGKIRLPEGMTLGYDENMTSDNSLYVNVCTDFWEDTMDENTTTLYCMMSDSVSVNSTPDADGLYSFEKYVDYNETIGKKYTLSINGTLNNKNVQLYYQVGLDTNDTDDHTVDGDEKLVVNKPEDSRYIEFFTPVADFGVLDINESFNNSALLTGTFTPPSNADSNNGITLNFSTQNNSYSKSIYMYVYNSENKDFSFRVPKSLELETNGLNLSIDFGSKVGNYSFGTDNAIVDANVTATALVLDFNATMPVLNIDLSNYEIPDKQKVTGKIRLPEGMTLGYDENMTSDNSLYVNVCTDFWEDTMDENTTTLYCMMSDSVSVNSTPDADGLYSFEKYVDYNETIGKKYTLSINGTLNNKNVQLYYQVGLDTNDTDDHTVDGDEKLVVNKPEDSRYIEFFTPVADFGVLDMENNTVYSYVPDTAAPVITLLGANPQTIERTNAYEELNATTDDGSPIVIDSSAVDTNVTGSYTVTYTATDLSGNSTETNRTVEVIDTTAPVITLLGVNPQTIERTNAYEELNATTDDGSPIVIDSLAVDTNVTGSYTVTYTATDLSDNTVEVNRTVEVIDTTAPVLTLIGANPQTLERGEAYVELNATTDDGSPIVINSSAIDMSVADTYIVTYTATDASGNTVEVNRTVEVNDTVTPVITLIGDNPQTLERGTAYVELNATVDDNITDIIIDSSAVDMNTVGEYNVTYNATDVSGNVATEVIRTVIVEDNIAPVITLLGANPQTLVLNEVYVELNATTNDGSIVVIDSSAVDMSVVGTYIVKYNATDDLGNVATEVTREVIIILDTDGDGIPDESDTDDDNDGVLDANDDLPLNPNESVDTDGDGTGNNADRDDDNDGISDADENRWGFDPLDASDGGNADADGDGVSNADEIEAGSDPLDRNDTKKPKRFVPIMMDDITIMIPRP